MKVLIDRLGEFELAPGKNDLKRQPGIMLGLRSLHLSVSKRS